MDLLDAGERVFDSDPFAEPRAARGLPLRRGERLEQRLLRMQRDGPATGRGTAARCAQGWQTLGGKCTAAAPGAIAATWPAGQVTRRAGRSIVKACLGKRSPLGLRHALARIATPAACSGPIRALAK